MLATALLAGCSATKTWREIEVQLPSGELMKDVRVLVDEDVTGSKVSIICRTIEFSGLKLTGRRTRLRPQEVCASPGYWAAFAAQTRWVHPEKGTAELPDDSRECRGKAARWGSRYYQGVKNSTYETIYIRCMEEKGYQLFSLDE